MRRLGAGQCATGVAARSGPGLQRGIRARLTPRNLASGRDIVQRDLARHRSRIPPPGWRLPRRRPAASFRGVAQPATISGVLLATRRRDRRIVAVIGNAQFGYRSAAARYRRLSASSGVASRISTCVSARGYAVSRSRSTQTGTWSDGFSKPGHSYRSRPRSAGRWPAATAADDRFECPSSFARRRPGSPRRCTGRAVVDRAQRVGEPEAEQRLEVWVAGRNRASLTQAAGLWTSQAAGMTLKSPASTSGSSALSRCREYSRSRDIHLSL